MTDSVPTVLASAKRDVLLVEDQHTALCGYLALALQDAGYTVRTAHDRTQALAVLASPQPPALMLLRPRVAAACQHHDGGSGGA